MTSPILQSWEGAKLGFKPRSLHSSPWLSLRDYVLTVAAPLLTVCSRDGGGGGENGGCGWVLGGSG